MRRSVGSAHLIYPCNDHPRDKASFTFRFDVPAGSVGVANGIPLGRWTSGGRARPTMIHELAHMWFGNSVSPWEWSDLRSTNR